MDQIQTWIHDHSSEIIAAIVGGIILGPILSVITRVFKFARSYGWKQFLGYWKDAALHLAAIPKIKADAVLTASYLARGLASLIVNGILAILLALATFSSLEEPQWLRWTFGVACLLFVCRMLDKSGNLSTFYNATAGSTIEELKKANPIFRKWYNISDKKPFFEILPKTPTEPTTGPAPSTESPAPTKAPEPTNDATA